MKTNGTKTNIRKPERNTNVDDNGEDIATRDAKRKRLKKITAIPINERMIFKLIEEMTDHELTRLKNEPEFDIERYMFAATEVLDVLRSLNMDGREGVILLLELVIGMYYISQGSPCPDSVH